MRHDEFEYFRPARFGGTTLSPVNRWTLELAIGRKPLPCSVNSTDAKQHDLGELVGTHFSHWNTKSRTSKGRETVKWQD